MKTGTDVAFDDASFEKLARDLKAKTGVVLTGYRIGVARRRISRRARHVGCVSLADYYGYFKSEPREAGELARIITLPVSRFFRNQEVFESLRTKALPEIFSSAGEREHLVFWCAGCGEGEEPYSLAMILHSHFKESAEKFSIVGTDVNVSAIEKAKCGIYDRKSMSEISIFYKQKYFERSKEKWLLTPEIKSMVEFRRAALPDGRGVRQSSLIMIRNLLIYFDRAQQDAILKKIAVCLKSNGFLVLGKSEMLTEELREQFEAVSPYHRIYRKAS